MRMKSDDTGCACHDGFLGEIIEQYIQCLLVEECSFNVPRIDSSRLDSAAQCVFGFLTPIDLANRQNTTLSSTSAVKFERVLMFL